VTDARGELIQALLEGQEANRELRRTLQWGERQLVKLHREFERGKSLVDVLDRVDVGDVRERVSDAVEEFEATRHAVKVATFALAQEEGVSIGELSRKWQISRQRGSQYAHEANADH
jgi:hypothetical protein